MCTELVLWHGEVISTIIEDIDGILPITYYVIDIGRTKYLTDDNKDDNTKSFL